MAKPSPGEASLLADHNSYQLGQIVPVRKLLGD